MLLKEISKILNSVKRSGLLLSIVAALIILAGLNSNFRIREDLKDLVCTLSLEEIDSPEKVLNTFDFPFDYSFTNPSQSPLFIPVRRIPFTYLVYCPTLIKTIPFLLSDIPPPTSPVA